ncbi:MAG TPA: alkaline phosphatase family protein [Thermoanaerobaculia bacterium]|jgi:phospholipase C|nr:alkaline phosphatase family protein [Thermoanaerobaculia bacterium]
MNRPVIATLLFLVGGSLGAATPPPIRHVFIIVLENKGFDTTFGASSPATYLSQTLTAQGQLLRQYYGIGHKSLPNYLAMVSGQAPNGVTQADCLVYNNVVPGTQTSFFGQTLGQGCIYPAETKTVADQLTASGLTWKAYMQDIGSRCRHPALNSADGTLSARLGDQYAARHNPFIYFQSLLDSGECVAHDVELADLQFDLANAATTPNYAFIVPNLCEDGHDAPCVDGRPGGLVSADLFLRSWVPRILGSPAWTENGLLIITFDEAGSSDASACCNEMPGLNTTNPGGTGPGGGRTGAVLISRFIQPGSVNDTPYNHYALLRSIEDLFALPHLGFAAQPDLKPFGADVYNAQWTPVRGRPSRP